MSDELSFEGVSDFLDRVFNEGEFGYDEVERYIASKQQEESETPENPTGTASEFVRSLFEPAFKFLKAHPVLSLVPIAVMAAVGSVHAADLGNGFIPQGGLNLGQNHQPLVLDHVQHLGDQGPDVTTIGSELLKHVNAADIGNLTGENPITHKQYDTKYFKANAVKIIKRATEAIRRGVFTEDVRTLVVARQHASTLAEDGVIGQKTIGALNSLGHADMVPHLSAAAGGSHHATAAVVTHHGALIGHPQEKGTSNLKVPIGQESLAAASQGPLPGVAAGAGPGPCTGPSCVPSLNDYVQTGGPLAGVEPAVGSATVLSVQGFKVQVQPKGNFQKIVTPVPLTFEPVTVQGRQILRGGKPYIIHGVTVSTAHSGDGRKDVRYTLDYIGGEQTLRQMKEMGVNSIRTYYAPTKDLLDALAKYGITVTIGIPNYDDRTVPANEKIDIASGNYKQYIAQYKNHPAVLMWEFGNEYNMHPEWFNGDVSNWYQILNNAVHETKSIDGKHPVTTSQAVENGGLNAIAGIKGLDAVGFTVYRYNNLNNKEGQSFADEWKGASDKPEYLSEFGVLYSADPNAQANGTRTIWGEIQKAIDGGVNSGGYLMTWRNEDWKGEGENGNIEKNLGVLDSQGNPKPVYYVLRQLWNPKPVAASSGSESVLNNPQDELDQIQIQMDNLNIAQDQIRDLKAFKEAGFDGLQKKVDRAKKLEAIPPQSVEESLKFLTEQAKYNEDLVNSPVNKVESPVHVQVVFDYNFPWLSLNLTGGGSNPALTLTGDIPGSRLVEGARITQGLIKGSSTVLGQVVGPQELLNLVLQYDAQYKGQAVKGQDKVLNIDRGLARRILGVFSPIERVHVTSADQNGIQKDYNVYYNPFMQNFTKALSLPGEILPAPLSKIFYNPGAFTFQKVGIVFEYGENHKVFNYQAAQKQDGQRVYFLRTLHRLTDVEDEHHNPNDEYQQNKKNGKPDGTFSGVEKGTLKDPYVWGWETGYKIVIDENNTATIYRFYGSATMINNEMVQKISGNIDATTNDSIIQPVWSGEEIKREMQFLKSLQNQEGKDETGRVVVGVQRDSTNGAIIPNGFIHEGDTEKLNKLLDITVDENGVVHYKEKGVGVTGTTASSAVHEPTAVEKVEGVVLEEVAGPIREVKGIFKTSKVGEASKKFSNSKVPVVGAENGMLDHVGQYTFEGGKQEKDIGIKMNNPQYVGVIRSFNGAKPELVTAKDLDNLRDTFWLLELNTIKSLTNVSVRENNIEVTVNSHKFNLSRGALVKVENNQIVGVFEANRKTLADWLATSKLEVPRLNSIIMGEDQFGVSYTINQDGSIFPEPQAVLNIDDFIGFSPVRYAGPNHDGRDSSGKLITAQVLMAVSKDGRTTIPVPISENMMVKVDGSGQVIAILELGRKAYEMRRDDLLAPGVVYETGKTSVRLQPEQIRNAVLGGNVYVTQNTDNLNVYHIKNFNGINDGVIEFHRQANGINVLQELAGTNFFYERGDHVVAVLTSQEIVKGLNDGSIKFAQVKEDKKYRHLQIREIIKDQKIVWHEIDWPHSDKGKGAPDFHYSLTVKVNNRDYDIRTLFSVPNKDGGVDFKTREEVFHQIISPNGIYRYQYEINPETGKVVLKDGQPVMILKSKLGSVGYPDGFAGFPEIASKYVVIEKDAKGQEKSRAFIEPGVLKNYVGNRNVSIVRLNATGQVAAYINLNPDPDENPSVDIADGKGGFVTHKIDLVTGKINQDSTGYVSKVATINIKDAQNRDMRVSVFERHLKNGTFKNSVGIITRSGNFNAIGLDTMSGGQYVEFYPTEFENGKPIAGLAIVGPSDSKTPRQIYGFGPNYKILFGKGPLGTASSNDGISFNDDAKRKLNLEGHTLQFTKQHLDAGSKDRWFIVDETTRKVIGTIDPLNYGHTSQDRYYEIEIPGPLVSKTYLFRQSGNQALTLDRQIFNTVKDALPVTEEQVFAQVGPLAGKLKDTIIDIASEIGVKPGAKVEFERSKEVIIGNGSHIFYRIKGDPLARIIVSSSSESKNEFGWIVNTSFKGETPTKGYEISSLGHIYYIETQGNVSRDDLIKAWNLRSISGFDADNKQLAFNQFDKFVKVNRYRLIAGLSDESLKDPVLIRYLASGDPLNLDAVKEDRGSIRFMMYQGIETRSIDQGFPLNVVSGEISVQPDINRVLRETSFVRTVADPRDPANNYYEYAVNKFFRDGKEYGPGLMTIKYFYNTGKVVEEVKAGTKLLSLDEIPLGVSRHNDLTAQDQSYSTFETKAFVKGPHTYRYIREIVDKEATDGEKPLESIFQDGKLFATRKDGKINISPYFSPGIWYRIKYNIFAPVKDSEDVNELFQIASDGYDNNGNKYDVYLTQAPVEKQAGVPVYREIGHVLGTWSLKGVFIGFLSLFTYAYWGRLAHNFFSRFRKANGNTSSFKDLSEVLGDKIAHKIIALRGFSGQIPSISKERKGWEEVLENYFTGFSKDEIKKIEDEVNAGRFEIREDFQDLSKTLDLKNISEVRNAEDLMGTLKGSRSDIAVALNTLNEAGIDYEQQFELFKFLDRSRPSATVWTDLYYASLNVFNAKLKELIVSGKFSEYKELIKKVQTPEARMIELILEDEVYAVALQGFFQKDENKDLPLQILIEHFVRDNTQAITDRTLVKYFGKNLMDEPIYQQMYKKEHIDGIIQELYTRFMVYPRTFIDALKDKNPKYKIDAITDGGEPVYVDSFVIYRTQMLPRSALKENTIGAISVIAPEVLFMTKYLEYLNKEKASQSAELVGLHNNFWMHMLHINNWGMNFVPGLVKYITSPQGKQLDVRLRDIMHEGNIYEFFEYLNHKDIKEAVDIYEKLIEGSMKTMDVQSTSTLSCRKLDDMKGLKEKMAGVISKVNDINQMTSNKEEAMQELYNNEIKNLVAPFVEKVNERRKEASPWVYKIDELTKSRRGMLMLYALRIAPVFSRTLFEILAKTLGIKDVSALRDVYGVENKSTQWAVRILEYSLIAAGIAGGCLTGYVALPVLAVGMLMLPRILLGRVNNSSERVLWTGIFSAHAGIMALFAHHLFGTFATIAWFTLGFMNTALLLTLLAPVTFLGIYHLATFVKGYVLYVNSLATPTARHRVGLLHLLNPFSLDMVIWKRITPWLETKGWMPSWGKKLIMDHMRGFYTAHYMDLLKAEEDVGYLTGNRVLVKEHLIKLYTALYHNGLVTKKELDGQKNFLNNPHSLRYSFIVPDDPKAREYIFTNMMSFAYKRPIVSRYAYLTASGDHVISNDELFTHTLERHAAQGSINALGLREAVQEAYDAVVKYNRKEGMSNREALARGMKVANAYFLTHKNQDVRTDVFLAEAKKALTLDEFALVEAKIKDAEQKKKIIPQSLLGYLARTQKGSFDNILELIREAVKNDEAFQEFKKALGDVDETTDFLDRFKEAVAAAGFNKDQIAKALELFERFLNESRPNNKVGVQSMGETLIEHHLYAASEYGDMDYHRAVLEMANSSYASLPLAYEALGDKERNGEELTALEKVFYTRYNTYKKSIELKYKPIFQMAQIWVKMSRFEDKDTKTFKYQMQILEKDWTRGDALEQKYREAFAGSAFEVKVEGNKTFVIFSDLKDFADAVLKFRNDHYVQLLGTKLLSDMKDVIQMAYDIKTCRDNDVYIPFYEKGLDNNVPYNKNGLIGINLWASYERMANYDAHVHSYKGQATHRILLQSWLSREPKYVIINPTFRIWSSSDDSFSGIRLYKISQETFTDDVLRSRRNLTSFYGKGFVWPTAADSMLVPPGEDSAAFFMLQRTYPDIVSTHIPWMVWEWGRPSLLAESMVGTEMRYTFNVTRFLLDPGQYEVFFNKKIGYDVKLTNMTFFLHYLSAPLAMVLLVAVPALQGFSAFAYLSPISTFIMYSFIFMEAINIHNLMRHLRTSGSFWWATCRTAKDIFLGFPYYVSMLTSFVKGAILAANDLFSFILSQKEGHLGQQIREHRFVETRMLGLKESINGGFFRTIMGKGKLPLDGLVGMAGIGSWVFGALTNNPLAMSVTVFYLWASISFLTGTHILDVFKDSKGKMKGYSWSAMFGKSWGWPFLVLGLTTLAFCSSPTLMIGAGIFGAAAKMLSVAGLGLSAIGIVSAFWNVGEAIVWTIRECRYFLQDIFKSTNKGPPAVSPSNLVPKLENPPVTPKSGEDKSMLTGEGMGALKGIFEASFEGVSNRISQEIVNDNMGEGARNSIHKGGIDLAATEVDVESSRGSIRTAFDDPAMLRLLLNSDGLTPIIYDIKIMTPSMVDHFVGLN
jgi:hypothetical protein